MTWTKAGPVPEGTRTATPPPLPRSSDKLLQLATMLSLEAVVSNKAKVNIKGKYMAKFEVLFESIPVLD